MRYLLIFSLFTFPLLFLSCADEPANNTPGTLDEPVITIGDKTLNLTEASENTQVSLTEPIKIQFSEEIDIHSVTNAITLTDLDGQSIDFTVGFVSNNTQLVITQDARGSNQTYLLTIHDVLRSTSGKKLESITVQFTTALGTLSITSLKIGNTEHLNTTAPITDIPQEVNIEITFSYPVNPATITATSVRILRNSFPVPVTYSLSDNNRKLSLTSTQTLMHLMRHQLNIQNTVKGIHGETLVPFSKTFYTALDPTPKMPLLPHDEDDDNDHTNDLLSVVQKQTFQYFWNEQVNGMARERKGSAYVTSGGTGFGIMALIVGMERNFVSQVEGLDRMNQIVTFLENADRFHGAWPHWMHSNGNVWPFSTNDNGGDLVETAFLVEGLITFRQYLITHSLADEHNLVNRINTLWEGVEWDWYRKETNEDVLYWHWSPSVNWTMNLPIRGWNECLITYVLAASAPEENTIPKTVYDNGWARNGGMLNGNTYEGITLPLGQAYGGPLFFSHYSFLGLDPRNLSDSYANYWTQNVNHSRINYKYCVRNPKNFVGYSEDCWGLTASDNHQGYSAHHPNNDLGVITPTAALSSFPYTPTESMKALKFFYYTLGDRLWGEYGFYDAFNITQGWTASSYLAIDQGPIIVMIENYRTGLLWDLFMSAPEIQDGLNELGFTFN